MRSVYNVELTKYATFYYIVLYATCLRQLSLHAIIHFSLRLSTFQQATISLKEEVLKFIYRL